MIMPKTMHLQLYFDINFKFKNQFTRGIEQQQTENINMYSIGI